MPVGGTHDAALPGDPSADGPPAPVPGATVVPMRDTASGPEVLMIERAASIAYGGMWAFPGGRVDEDDDDPDAPDDEVARARQAAAREAEEEVGLRIAPHGLVPYSHWTGGADPTRRFAAWYFLAPDPGGEVVLDEAECRSCRWIRPADALDLRDRGEIAVVAPTWMTLHDLAADASVAAALSRAGGRSPVVYRSRVVGQDGYRVVLWKGDAGYEDVDPARPGPRHRLVMAASGWSFESS